MSNVSNDVNKKNNTGNVTAPTKKGKTTSWWQDTARHLREVWIEVRPKNGRVSWPTYESVKMSTKVVIFSSISLGIFIGILDILFSKILEKIIGA